MKENDINAEDLKKRMEKPKKNLKQTVQRIQSYDIGEL